MCFNNIYHLNEFRKTCPAEIGHLTNFWAKMASNHWQLERFWPWPLKLHHFETSCNMVPNNIKIFLSPLTDPHILVFVYVIFMTYMNPTTQLVAANPEIRHYIHEKCLDTSSWEEILQGQEIVTHAFWIFYSLVMM